MSVAADFPSGRKAFPSISNSASNLPSRQLFNTTCTVATSTPPQAADFGEAATIAPTLKSRFAQPSDRSPIPGAKESLTVE